MERKYKIVFNSVLLLIIVLNIYLYFNLNDYVANRISTPGVIDHRWTFVAETWYSSGIYSNGAKDDEGNYIPTFSVTPLYPLLYRISYFLFGKKKMPYSNEYEGLSYEFMRGFIAFLNFLIMIIIYKTAVIFDKKVGLLCILLCAINIDSYKIASNYGTPDTALAFFITLSFYYLIKFLVLNHNKINLILFSVMLNFAALTKYTSHLVWIPLICFLIIYLSCNKNINAKNKIIYLVIFIGINCILQGGWMARNYYVCGTWKFTSHKAPLHLVSYLIAHNEKTNYTKTYRSLNKKVQDDKRFKNRSEGNKSVYVDSLAKDIILSHPIQFAYLTISRSFSYLLNTKKPGYMLYNNNDILVISDIYKRYKINHKKSFIPVTIGIVPILWRNGYYSFVVLNLTIKIIISIVMIFFLYGIYVIYKEDRPWSNWVIVCSLIYILYFCFVCGLTVNARLRAPIMAIIYFISSYGIIHCFLLFMKLKFYSTYSSLKNLRSAL